MDALLHRLSSPTVALPILLFVVFSVYNRLTAVSNIPAGLPWVGKDSSNLFANTRAKLASFTNVREWLEVGYNKYGQNNLSYILPNISGRTEIVLPRSQTAWLLEQPDNVLSTSAFHYDSLEGEYAFTTPQILKDPYHEHVLHKYLPRRIAPLIPDMWEEIRVAMDQTWGMDTQAWKEIGIWKNMMRIIPSITNRMTLGLPLCRNEDFLKNVGKFAMDVITCASIYLMLTPRFLKPIIGPLITIPNTRHWRNTAKYTLPIITKRLANFNRKQEDPSFEWDEPNDYVSWHINIATAEGRHDELTPDMISRRLMPINFAAIHTTALSVTNTIFDLLSSEYSLEWLEGIREEAERVLAEEGGQWTKAGLARCHRSDSAIRESMRISNFMTRNVLRKVMPEEGIENKAEGWRAPKGVLLGLDMHSVQHDPKIYPDPNTYDAFRFSRPREEADALMVQSEVNGIKNTGLTTTSDIFLPFSHGRHACPGRFFVALEMKLLLAYMVMNYEVEPLKSRPPNVWFGQSSMPPMKASIKVRRKEGTT
ncbi:MAG: hypothetical protein Q9175_002948 [Cornicularia normoerica]